MFTALMRFLSFKTSKETYEDDKWSFIDGINNDWKSSKSKKKPKHKKKKSPITKFKTPNPYEDLNI